MEVKSWEVWPCVNGGGGGVMRWQTSFAGCKYKSSLSGSSVLPESSAEWSSFHTQTLEPSAIAEMRPRSRNLMFFSQTHGIRQKNGKIMENAIIVQYFLCFMQKFNYLARTEWMKAAVRPRAWNSLWYFHNLYCYHATKCENNTEDSKVWGPNSNYYQ